jgi:putative transposase
MCGILLQRVWWFGITNDIRKLVSQCQTCQINAKLPPPEPIVSTELPEGPGEEYALDFIGPIDSLYALVLVDLYSRFLSVQVMATTNTAKTIRAVKKMFAFMGYPKRLRADNGPQFQSEEFKRFVRERNIKLNLVISFSPA